MAEGGTVEFVLKARDEATDVLRKVAGGITDINENLVKMAEAAGPLGLIAGGAVALGASMEAAGIKIAETSDQLEHAARRTGLSIEMYQELTQAIKNSGGSTEGFFVAIQHLNQAIAEHNPLIDKLKLNTTDTAAAFMDLMKVVADSPDHFKATDDAMKLLGRSAGELIGSAKEIADNFDQVVDRANKFNSVVKDDTVQQTKALRKELLDLSAAWNGLLIAFQQFSVPFATFVTGILAKAVGLFNELGRNVMKAFDGLGKEIKKELDDILGPAGDQFGPHPLLTLPDDQGVTVSATKLGKANFPDLMDTIHNFQANAKAGTFFEPNQFKLRGVSEKKGETVDGEFDKIYKLWLDKVKDIKLKTSDAFDIMKFKADVLHAALEKAGESIAGTISQAVSAVISGVQTIGEAFHSLVVGILQDIAQSAAEYGIGLGLSLLGFAIGGPVGGFIAGVGGHLAGVSPGKTPAGDLTAGPGNTTFVIQTISAKDMLQSLASPTGAMRSANSRLREIAKVS